MNENITNVLQKPWVIPAAVGVVSLGGGFAAGYIYGRRSGVSDFINTVTEDWDLDGSKNEEEPEEAQTGLVLTPEDFASYQNVIKTQEYKTYTNPVEEFIAELVANDIPEEEDDATPVVEDEDEDITPLATDVLVEDEHEVPEDQHVLHEVEHSSPAAVRSNVFEQTDDSKWNYDAEIAHREQKPDEPYIIHVDEFTRNDLGYQQETLTYYAEDDVLADIKDSAVYNYQKLTGSLRFGHGSNDKSVTYIRNEPLRMEWEIFLNTGSYEDEVNGVRLEDEQEERDLKHSNNRKFRQEE